MMVGREEEKDGGREEGKEREDGVEGKGRREEVNVMKAGREGRNEERERREVVTGWSK